MATVIPSDGARYFSKGFGENHAHPSFQYIWDSGVVWQNLNGNLITGGMRPVIPADLGTTSNVSVSGLSLTVGAVNLTGVNIVTLTGDTAVRIVNTAPINITGFVNTIVTGSISASVNAVAITGNPGFVLTGVASTVTINVNNAGGYVGVTGTATVSVANTAPMPISGVVQAAVTIGNVAVTGGSIVAIDTGVRAINVTNTAPMPISGVVQATLSVASVVDAQVSGNALATTANVLLSGISGALAGNLTDVALVNDVTGNLYLAAISGLLGTNLTSAAWVTGAVSITNTAPINISGWVTTIVTGGTLSFDSTAIVNAQATGNNLTVTSNVLLSGISGIFAANIAGASWVTGTVAGTKTDTNSTIFGSPATPYAVLPIGGRAVAATGAGSITGGYNTGDYVMFSFNKDNGGLFVNQANLDASMDTVTMTQSGVASVSNQAVSGVSSGAYAGQVLFQANPNRLGYFIQNLHTGALMLRFSTSLPTTGLMNVLLKGGSTLNDGNGASWSEMPCVFRGPVSCSGFGGSPALFTAWEI